MLTRSLALAVIVGGALWAMAPAPASAMIPAAPIVDQNVTPSGITEARYYRRYYRHHHRHCWRGRYGRLHCRYY
jgi:hypothetical protein